MTKRFSPHRVGVLSPSAACYARLPIVGCERSRRVISAVMALVLVLTGCTPIPREVRRDLSPPPAPPQAQARSPYLIAHMRSGQAYVLDTWAAVPDSHLVRGQGRLLDAHRAVMREGSFAVATDSVALFETNQVVIPGWPMTFWAITTVVGVVAATALVALLALAAFGSCPTFYAWDGKQRTLQAEGFSSSVAPALEASDVDALFRARPTRRDFEVVMKNEALETHVIRHADILAVRRPAGGRIIAAADGSFRQALALVEPASARGPEGDCRAALRAYDGVERSSLTDTTDLARQEVVELEFDRPPGADLGVVIASRQSLLSSFLFYQGLAYAGRSAGQILAALGQRDAPGGDRLGEIWRIIGGIKVSVEDSTGAWRPVGELKETGPLAADLRVIPVPHPTTRSLHVRLQMARGGWRLDWVGLAVLGKRVEPLRLQPSLVRRGQTIDTEARSILVDSTRTLTTLPGDRFTLVYRLPEHFEEYELFLNTRGYYLEWMRQAWMDQEDAARTSLMLLDPRAYLRAVAPEYKRVEAAMEAQFWSSRYAVP